MGRSRKRSGSGSSYKELSPTTTASPSSTNSRSNNNNGTTTAQSNNSGVESGNNVPEHQQQAKQQHKQERIQEVRQWMYWLLTSRQQQDVGQGKSCILHETNNFPLLVAYMTRAQQLDHYPSQLQHHQQQVSGVVGASCTGKPSSSSSFFGSLQERMLLERDVESSYTALHWAIYRADLACLLFLLRHAASEPDLSSSSINLSNKQVIPLVATTTTTTSSTTGSSSNHSIIRPMSLLEFTASSSSTQHTGNNPRNCNTPCPSSACSTLSLWQTLVTARDAQGYTPGELLTSLQRTELRACRASLMPRPQIDYTRAAAAAAASESQQHCLRPSSFDLTHRHEDEDDELNLLNQHMNVLMSSSASSSSSARRRRRYDGEDEEEEDDDGTEQRAPREEEECQKSTDMEYGCEVLTFGRAHHCALGVGTDGATTTTKTTSATSSSPSSNGSSTTTTTTSTTTTTFRPQRVQAFAQSEVGRRLSAVAVAAAAHHTLVLNKAGQVFAFGLGKGGRLGIGNHERHSPLPTLVTIARGHHCVTAITAAENHSLAVTADGFVYAWGSNRFGQLGISSSSSPNSTATKSSHNTTTSCALTPRRVDDLKDVCIRSVAAGERHSVALSNTGGIYVWGDNSSGQLGVPPRHHGGGITVSGSRDNGGGGGGGGGPRKLHKNSSSSSSSHHNPVQRVQHPALQSKIAVAIAASEYTTVALTSPSRDGKTLPVNAIYAWGHGNHVPSKVHLQQQQQQQVHGIAGRQRRRRTRSHSWNEDESQEPRPFNYHQQQRLVNPIAIACAKYHNVAITQNGLVYTWGFHSETLGNTNSNTQTTTNTNNNKSNSTATTAPCWRATTPQLVKGMLPEQGGGCAVTVSASENHTAVVTDTGALYTWGATHGPNILGHEGVRWQPNPKKVPGLYRAVAVAAAKEHFVVLAGTSFPPLPTPPASAPSPLLVPAAVRINQDDNDQKPSFIQHTGSSVPTLEELAARKVTKYVDLFNVWPILITAERVQSATLIRYCHEFCKRNLDGVLNVGQRRVMDSYLTEQLQTHNHHRLLSRYVDDVDADWELLEQRDARWHPILQEFVQSRRPTRPNSGSGPSSNNHVPLLWSSYPGTADTKSASDMDDWIASCTKLMQSHRGGLFLQTLRKLQELDKCGMSRGGTSHFNNMTTAKEEETKNPSVNVKRARGVSFGEDRIVTVSSQGSPRCLELIANLLGDEDKSTNSLSVQDKVTWLEEKQRALLKEVRALRKRLNQISKLVEMEMKNNQEQEGDDVAEATTTSRLSPEEREKVARKALLLTDLNLLEPALRKVNARLQQLLQQQRPPSTSPEEEKESLMSERKTETTGSDNNMAETTSSKTTCIRCNLCRITCSDASSYSLHINGRKHRNRVLQVEQEERERTAALVVAEQQQKELQKQSSTVPASSKTTPTNPWKKTSEASNSAPLSPTPQPVYKLPPPPHGVPSTLVCSTTKKASTPSSSKVASAQSLLDIMAAEEKTQHKEASAKRKMGRPKPKTGGAWPVAVSSPATSKAVCNQKGQHTSSSSPQGTAASWQLKVDILPTLDSPPWAAAPVACVTVPQDNSFVPTITGGGNRPATCGRAVASAERTKTPSYSLGDFIATAPSASSSSSLANSLTPTSEQPPKENEVKARPTAVSPKQPAWLTPSKTTGGANAGSGNAMTTATKLVHIQDEEIAFKEKQDAACGEAQAVWFVQRRERAGSLKEIQRSAEKERKHRLFVEEQHRIEQRILEEQRELQQQKEQKQNATTPKSSRRKRSSNQNNRRGRRGKGGGGDGVGDNKHAGTVAEMAVATSDNRDGEHKATGGDASAPVAASSNTSGGPKPVSTTSVSAGVGSDE